MVKSWIREPVAMAISCDSVMEEVAKEDVGVEWEIEVTGAEVGEGCSWCDLNVAQYRCSAVRGDGPGGGR